MFKGIVFFIPNKTHVRDIRPLTFKKTCTIVGSGSWMSFGCLGLLVTTPNKKFRSKYTMGL